MIYYVLVYCFAVFKMRHEKNTLIYFFSGREAAVLVSSNLYRDLVSNAHFNRIRKSSCFSRTPAADEEQMGRAVGTSIILLAKRLGPLTPVPGGPPVSDRNGSHFLIRCSVDSVKTSFYIAPL